jgi:hypothetical protein
MRYLTVVLLAVSAFSAASAAETFTGTITDDMCARGDHSGMQMGPNDAECTKSCVILHDAEYVLFDGKAVYVLSDQKLPEKFAGQRVHVTGTLDSKTKKIKVESITASR